MNNIKIFVINVASVNQECRVRFIFSRASKQCFGVRKGDRPTNEPSRTPAIFDRKNKKGSTLPYLSPDAKIGGHT